MSWPWLLALAALLAALAGIFLWRRRGTRTPATIATPVANAASPSDAEELASAPEPPQTPAAAPRAWLNVDARALQFRRSMMNAALSYRLTVTNRSGQALEGVAIEADLGTAHGRLPVDQQLASAATALTARHTLERLAPGERATLEGDIQLPLNQVQVIQQGKAILAVPLLRLRAVHQSHDALARTWVVGQANPEPGGKLRPFRLDAPPQTYKAIGQRPLD